MPHVIGRLEWTLGWGWTARLVVLALALTVLGFAWANLRHHASMRERAALLGLRGALVLGLLVVFLQPTWVQERSAGRDRVIAVLVDASRSMGHNQRLARARQAAKSLSGRAGVRLYAVGERLRPLRDPDALDAEDGDSDLVGALSQLAETAGPSAVAAVVVISDGLDPKLSHGLSDAARETLATLGVPVHTVSLPDLAPLPDVAITAVRASPFAFARNVLPIEIDLSVDGQPAGPGEITVVASLDGVPVASRLVSVDGPRRRTIALEVQPKLLGGHVLSVAATALPNEVTRVNNRVHRALHVVRDRVRVLHLAGHPSWDTRFLRSHLGADPAVDLISFYIMVGRGGGVFVRSADTTLIPFPSEQLFGPALDDFDLIVFSDFDFAPFGIERFLPNMRRWVSHGGAFAVFGGPEALSAGGYERSSIALWLPVRLDAASGANDGWREGEFSPRRTELGTRHAITRLAATDADNEALWRRLTLAGLNSRTTPREGAAVLLQGPEGAPLLTVSEFGEGRIAVLGTDSLWSWAFPDGETQGRDAIRAAYHHFLGRMRGWLLKDPAFAAVQLSVDRDVLLPGQPAVVVAQVLGLDQRPAQGVRVVLRPVPLPADADAVGHPAAAQATTDAAGQARLRWTPPIGGPWRLDVEATVDGRVRRGRVAVAVAEAADEDLHLQAAPERLAALSQATSGQRWRNTPPATAVPTAPDRSPVVHEHSRTELWSSPWVALALLLLLTGEWALRRRWGLA